MLLTDCTVTKLTCYVEKMRVITYAPMIGRVPNTISLILAERLVYINPWCGKKKHLSAVTGYLNKEFCLSANFKCMQHWKSDIYFALVLFCCCCFFFTICKVGQWYLNLLEGIYHHPPLTSCGHHLKQSLSTWFPR